MTARHASPLEALLVDARFDADVYPNEPLARHTTYRIGGPARYFVHVESVGALMRLVAVCEETNTPWAIIGRGSNLLVADEGFAGVAVSLGRDFRTIHYDAETNRICAGGGALLSAAVQEAFHRSLAGLEFAVGTPGTVGGAVRMNAGSGAEWIGSRIASVTTFSSRTGLLRRAGRELEWGYRTSSIQSDEVVVECEIVVEPADPFFIRGKMEASLSKRKKRQPMNEACCGSVFKNPAGASAAELIEGAGLKGLTLGGAQVSNVHANFIVNMGNATAADVCALIQTVQTKVYEAYGVELSPEVKFLGFE